MIIPCLSCILQLSVHDELFLSAFKNNLALCHKCNHDQKINHNENYSLWDYVSLCSPLWLFLITSFLHCQNSQKSGLYILSPISQFFFSPSCKPTIGITTIFYAMRVIKCTNDHHAAINDRTSYKHFFLSMNLKPILVKCMLRLHGELFSNAQWIHEETSGLSSYGLVSTQERCKLPSHFAVCTVSFIATNQTRLFVFQSPWQQDRINNNEFNVGIIHNKKYSLPNALNSWETV